MLAQFLAIWLIFVFGAHGESFAKWHANLNMTISAEEVTSAAYLSESGSILFVYAYFPPIYQMATITSDGASSENVNVGGAYDILLEYGGSSAVGFHTTSGKLGLLETEPALNCTGPYNDATQTPWVCSDSLPCTFLPLSTSCGQTWDGIYLIVSMGGVIAVNVETWSHHELFVNSQLFVNNSASEVVVARDGAGGLCTVICWNGGSLVGATNIRSDGSISGNWSAITIPPTCASNSNIAVVPYSTNVEVGVRVAVLCTDALIVLSTRNGSHIATTLQQQLVPTLASTSGFVFVTNTSSPAFERGNTTFFAVCGGTGVSGDVGSLITLELAEHNASATTQLLTDAEGCLFVGLVHSSSAFEKTNASVVLLLCENYTTPALLALPSGTVGAMDPLVPPPSGEASINASVCIGNDGNYIVTLSLPASEAGLSCVFGLGQELGASQDTVAWTYCSSSPIFIVFATPTDKYVVTQEYLTSLDLNATGATHVNITYSTPSLITDRDNDVAYVCIDQRVVCTDIEFRVTHWSTAIATPCQNAELSISSDSSIVFARGFNSVEGVLYLSVVPVDDPSNVVRAFPALLSTCNYASFVPPSTYTSYGTPLLVPDFGLVFSSIIFSNCLQLVFNMSEPLGSGQTLVTLNFTSYLANASIFYSSESEYIVQAGITESGEAGLFAVSVPLIVELCTLVPQPSCTIVNPQWTLAVPNLLTWTVILGRLYIINTFFTLALQCVDLRTGLVLWMVSLSDVVHKPLPLQPPVIYMKEMDVTHVCVAFGVLACYDPGSGSRTFLLTHEDLFGLPILTESSQEVFLMPERIFALDDSGNKSWSMYAMPEHDFGAGCEWAHTRGNLLYALCSPYSTRSTTVKRLFLLDLRTGTMFLSGGPFALSLPRTFDVSYATGTIVLVSVWGKSIVVIPLVIEASTATVDGQQFFCAQSNNEFFSFASNWKGAGLAAQATPFNSTLGERSAAYAPQLLITRFKFRDAFVGDVGRLSNEQEILRVFNMIIPNTTNAELQFICAQPTPYFRIGGITVGSFLCNLCRVAACPSLCTIDFTTGLQVRVTADPPFLNVSNKTVGSEHFTQTPQSQLELVLNQTLLIERSGQYFVRTNESFFASPSNCSAGVTGIVAPGPFCYVDHSLVDEVYRVTFIPKINSTILSRVVIGSSTLQIATAAYPAPVFVTYPNASTSTGDVLLNPLLTLLTKLHANFLPPGSVEGATFVNKSLVVLNVRKFDQAFASQEVFGNCSDFIPVCPPLFTAGPANAATTQRYGTWYFASRLMRSVVFRPSSLSSQWRATHVSVDSEFHLDDFALPSVQDSVEQCFPSAISPNPCPTQCMPDYARCSSVLFLDVARFVFARVTSGNPLASLQVYSNYVDEPLVCFDDAQNVVKSLLIGSMKNDTRVTVACQDGRVRMFAVAMNNTALIDIPDGAADPYLQVQVRCSPCSYFLLEGVASQPLLMMLAAAVKSLGIVLLTFAATQNKRFMRALHSRYARCLTTLANFRFDDTVGKEGFRKIVEGNFAPPVVDFEEVTRRLQWWIAFKESLETSKEMPARASQIPLARAQSRNTMSRHLQAGDDELLEGGQYSIRSFEPSEDGCFVSTPEPVDPVFVEFYYTKLCEGQAWIVDGDSIAPEVRIALQEVYAAFKPQLHEYANAVDGEEQRLLPSSLSPTRTGGFSRISSFIDRRRKLTAKELTSFSTDDANPTKFHFQLVDLGGPAMLTFKERFVSLRREYPESFEYVLLPNRILDNRLAPLPFVILFNAAYCTIFLLVCMFRVVGTSLSWFDRYQVVFYLFFNSTAIGSLVVDCVMRPLLLRRNWRQDPYIRVAVFFISLPALTHCLPGALYYAWIFVPLMGLPIAFETFLRHQQELTLRRNRALAFTLRSTARIVLVFATCATLSMSYNYAALGVWNRVQGSASPLDAIPRFGYLDIPQHDFDSRSFVCMAEEWFSSVAVFLQHFATIIGLF